MTTTEYINGLRQLADFYERNPECKLPYEGNIGTMFIFCDNAEDFARIVAAFGNGAKRFRDDALVFIPEMGGLQLSVHCAREQVCERRVVGTKHVPEKVIPQQVIPAHDEDIVEWDCKPILAKRPVTVEVVPELPAAAEPEAVPALASSEIEVPF